MNTNRFRQCFYYKLRGLVVPTAVYLAIYILARFGLPLVVWLLADDTMTMNMTASLFGDGVISLLSVSFWFSTSIFLFIGGVASFREEFNHLLAMNNTRQNQFWSAQLAQLTVIFALTILSGVFGLLEHLMDSWINHDVIFGSFYGIDAGAFIGVYLSGLALLGCGFLLAHAFGETAGVLAYRIGRAFIVPFWICFGLAFVLVPILATGSAGFNRFLSWYFTGIGSNYYLSAALHILMTAVILKVISLLAIRKIPQSA